MLLHFFDVRRRPPPRDSGVFGRDMLREEGPSPSVPAGEDMPPPADEEESTLPSPEFPEEEEIPTDIPA